MSVPRRVAESFRSEIQAFVYDTRIVDDGEVKSVISRLGVGGLLARWEENGVAVYYIDRRRLAQRCFYEECSGLEGVARDRCIEHCVQVTMAKLAESISRGVMELSESIEASRR